MDARSRREQRTRERADVARSGKKLGRQKGGGTARHGDRRAPVFIGGGKAHGARVRDFNPSLNKKIRALGLKMALSAKAKDGSLIVLNGLDVAEGKTKTLAQQLKGLGFGNKALVIDGDALNVSFANASGNLRGEYGHPRYQPGMTMDDFVNRVRDIYEPHVCMHIRKVTVDYTTYRNAQGQPVITIIGEVKPSGPMGPALKEQFENKHEDVCFSIRSLTNDEFSMGRVNKHIKLIVTWDYVNEPGLANAHKWNAPGLESYKEDDMKIVVGEAASLSEQFILPGQLKAMLDRQKATGVSMESEGGVSMESFIEAISTDLTVKRPRSSEW